MYVMDNGFKRVKSLIYTKSTNIAEISNKQITIQHNFIKYSYSYMFRHYEVIVRLTFRTYEKEVHIALWTLHLTSYKYFYNSVFLLLIHY